MCLINSEPSLMIFVLLQANYVSLWVLKPGGSKDPQIWL